MLFIVTTPSITEIGEFLYKGGSVEEAFVKGCERIVVDECRGKDIEVCVYALDCTADEYDNNDNPDIYIVAEIKLWRGDDGKFQSITVWKV